MEPLLGHRLGKYQILEELGRGGMATVYKGYDPVLDRLVVVKVLALHLTWEKAFVQRFMREARAVARLNHPNIVTIYDVGQENTWYYFVMEYLVGPSLQEVLQRRGAMPPDEVLRILRQLADTLDYSHQEGLVHQDLKPGNVMFGSRGRAILTDFGLAQMTSEDEGSSGVSMGTPEYMAPEQIVGGQVGPWTDLYALAVVAYEMLAGRPPSKATMGPSLLYQVLNQVPPSIRNFRPGLPEAVGTVLERALSKEPQARYANATMFVAALEGAILGGMVSPKEIPSIDLVALAGGPGRAEELAGLAQPQALVGPTLTEESEAQVFAGEQDLAAPPLVDRVAPAVLEEVPEPSSEVESIAPVLEAVPVAVVAGEDIAPAVLEEAGPAPVERVSRLRLGALPIWLRIVLLGGLLLLSVGAATFLTGGLPFRQSTPTATPTPTPTPTATLLQATQSSEPSPSLSPSPASVVPTVIPQVTPSQAATSAPTVVSPGPTLPSVEPTAESQATATAPPPSAAPSRTPVPTTTPPVQSTDTPPPATDTPKPPTPEPTPEPTEEPPTPTDTPLPPTPTDTPLPPTPTDTPLPPTPTDTPLTPTPTEPPVDPTPPL